jgi:quercetin dioxygenase-like cupin family protein
VNRSSPQRREEVVMSRKRNRRQFLGAAAASLLPIGLDAQRPGATPVGELARHTLTGPLEGFDAVLIEANFQPGTGRPHRHPGIVLGYVVDGQVRFAVNNEQERVVAAGSTFFEPFGAVHTTSGSARPDAPARVLIFMVVPTGSALTGPA